eukprot:g3466.t1
MKRKKPSSTTNPNIGRFHFKASEAFLLPGFCALSLLYAGSAGAQDELETFEPSESVEELDALVVTASADASVEGLPEAYAGGQVARGGRVGILGALDYMETPFNATSYTSEFIENQQASSIGDVLEKDSAVRVTRGFGNFQQVYKLRGLPIYSDDMTLNGLFGLLPRQYLATEMVERVEVFHGANAFLNGSAPGGSSLGGTVNILPKRAGNDPLNEVTVGIEGGGQYYGAADVSRRYYDGKLGVRLNAALRDGETAVDNESVQIGIFSLGLDWQTESLRISGDFGYQEVNLDEPQPSVTFLPGVEIPSAPNASENFAQPWTYSDATDVFGVLRAEYDFNESWTAWGAFGVRSGEEENSLANPRNADSAGNTNSYRFDNAREDSVWTGELGIRGDFFTGPVRHQPTLSFTAFKMEEDNAYAFSDFGGFAGNIYNPYDVPAPTPDALVGGDLSSPGLVGEIETSSIALADKISMFDERLILIAGARYQNIGSTRYDYNTGAQISNYSESAVTPVVGALYKFTDEISGYANYIEGLSPGAIAPATSGGTPVTNAGESLDPYVTEQFEIGAKFDYGTFGGSISAFQSEQPIAGINSSGVFTEISDQRYRGIELSGFGEITDGVRVLAGLSFLDTEENGTDQIGSPTVQGNLSAEWDVPFVAGLTLDGGVIYTSSQFVDSANTQEIPSWTRIDLGARYRYELDNGQDITLRARVENVADRDYWAAAAVEAAVPGHAITGWSLHRDNPRAADGVYVMPFGTREWHLVTVDPYRGTVLGTPELNANTLKSWILTLHTELFLGHFGVALAGIFGLAFCFLGLSGIYLYRRFWKTLFRLRLGASMRMLTGDIHRLTGVFSVGFNLLFGFTGAYWNLSHTLEDIFAPHHHEEDEVLFYEKLFPSTLDLQALQTNAREQIPGFETHYISFPWEPGGVFTLWGCKQDSPWFRSSYGSQVSYNGQTGSFLSSHDLTKQGLWPQIEDTFEPLHFGNFGGLLPKLFWCAAGFAPAILCLSGMSIWWQRRKSVGRNGKRR